MTVWAVGDVFHRLWFQTHRCGYWRIYFSWIDTHFWVLARISLSLSPVAVISSAASTMTWCLVPFRTMKTGTIGAPVTIAKRTDATGVKLGRLKKSTKTPSTVSTSWSTTNPSILFFLSTLSIALG